MTAEPAAKEAYFFSTFSYCTAQTVRSVAGTITSSVNETTLMLSDRNMRASLTEMLFETAKRTIDCNQCCALRDFVLAAVAVAPFTARTHDALWPALIP